MMQTVKRLPEGGLSKTWNDRALYLEMNQDNDSFIGLIHESNADFIKQMHLLSVEVLCLLLFTLSVLVLLVEVAVKHCKISS